MNDEETGTVGWVVHGSRRQKPRARLIRYLVLYVIVVFGVAAGVLLANWVTGKGGQDPDEIAAGRAASTTQTDGGLGEKAGQVASKVGSGIQTVFKQAAAKVKVGNSSKETEQDLKQQCEDWKRAFEQGHTEAARSEMVKACGRYQTFIAAGGPTAE